MLERSPLPVSHQEKGGLLDCQGLQDHSNDPGNDEPFIVQTRVVKDLGRGHDRQSRRSAGGGRQCSATCQGLGGELQPETLGHQARRAVAGTDGKLVRTVQNDQEIGGALVGICGKIRRDDDPGLHLAASDCLKDLRLIVQVHGCIEILGIHQRLDKGTAGCVAALIHHRHGEVINGLGGGV